MRTTVETTNPQFVNDKFNGSQARDYITNHYMDKINFYKLMKWSLIVNNEQADTSTVENKIKQLKSQMRQALDLVREAGVLGKQVRINGTLGLEISD